MTLKRMENNKHISDELLAAYLEGNINGKEASLVLRAVKADVELQETLDVAMRLEDEELPLMQMAAEGGRNLCDVQCETFVLKRCGIRCDTDELLEIAKDNHWIRRAGTPLNCIGNLLEYKGLNVIRKHNASIEDVADALEKGFNIIVAVDCDKLYPERPDEEDATNHAIVVTGIDGEANVVTIFDPENISEVDVQLSLFMSAWKESCCYMVSACP
jgi:hypothetical protein